MRAASVKLLDRNPAAALVAGVSAEAAAVRGGERELNMQAGTRTLRAFKEDSTSERLDAIPEADEPGAVGEVGAARAIVADRNTQEVVRVVGFDADRDC